MIHRRYAFFAAVLGLGLVAAAPAPVELASVRATYDVSLKHALPAGLVAVRGRTAIEFRKTCDGYKTTQRFLADMTNAQGNVSRTDFAVTAWESRNGRAMRFDITNMVDGEVAERYKGRATIRAAGPGEVALALPKSERFALPAGTVLPTTQTVAVIRAAERGARSYAGTVFLGGGRADLYRARPRAIDRVRRRRSSARRSGLARAHELLRDVRQCRDAGI